MWFSGYVLPRLSSGVRGGIFLHWIMVLSAAVKFPEDSTPGIA